MRNSEWGLRSIDHAPKARIRFRIPNSPFRMENGIRGRTRTGFHLIENQGARLLCLHGQLNAEFGVGIAEPDALRANAAHSAFRIPRSALEVAAGVRLARTPTGLQPVVQTVYTIQRPILEMVRVERIALPASPVRVGPSTADITP